MDFAQAERERTTDIDLTHPALAAWAGFWFAGDEELGRFPLPLGTTADQPVELERYHEPLLTGRRPRPSISSPSGSAYAPPSSSTPRSG